MVNLGRSHLRRWRSVALGGPLQRACQFCFAAHDGQAKTRQIAEWCRPEIVGAGGKPTAVQIAKHARALRSIGAKRVRREGRQWVWRMADSRRAVKRAGFRRTSAPGRKGFCERFGWRRGSACSRKNIKQIHLRGFFSSITPHVAAAVIPPSATSSKTSSGVPIGIIRRE
jgi:hypothetical protein